MYIHKIVKNKILKKVKPSRFVQDEEIKRWYIDGGDDRFRYDYPLDSNSVIVDAGAYHGEWSNRMDAKYHCHIFAFEPVKEYYKLTKKTLKGINKATVYQEGLAGKTRKEKIYLDEVATSIFKETAKPEIIQLTDIKSFCSNNKIKHIDVIKINIEGREYELLERIIQTGLINHIDHLQIQFHNFVPRAENKMIQLQRQLSKTHTPTYQYYWIWDNWERKGL